MIETYKVSGTKLDFDDDELVKQKDIEFYRPLEMDDDDLNALIRFIEKSTVLEKLDLAGNGLGDCSSMLINKLAKAIANSKTLKVLCLNSNRISLRGVKYLADALKDNYTLKELHLQRNYIDDKEAKYLTDMLIVNKTLQKLNLGYNELTLSDGKLAAAIAKNKTIKVLDLHSNSLRPKGVKLLADALKENNTLQELHLNTNNIRDEGAKYTLLIC